METDEQSPLGKLTKAKAHRKLADHMASNDYGDSVLRFERVGAQEDTELDSTDDSLFEKVPTKRKRESLAYRTTKRSQVTKADAKLNVADGLVMIAESMISSSQVLAMAYEKYGALQQVNGIEKIQPNLNVYFEAQQARYAKMEDILEKSFRKMEALQENWYQKMVELQQAQHAKIDHLIEVLLKKQ